MVCYTMIALRAYFGFKLARYSGSLVHLHKEGHMPGKFLVNLTSGPENTDKATVAFVIANASVASDKDTVVFLSIEASRLSQKGVAETIHEEGFAPLKELVDNFVKAGGKILVCSPCFKKRKLDEQNLVPGATIVGGAKLVEFMSDDCPSVSY